MSAAVHVVAPDEADLRLDRWFKRHFPEVSHGTLEKWLRTGQVRVDGKRAKSNLRLIAAQEIRVPPHSAQPAPARPKPPASAPDARLVAQIKDAILHIDDQVIVLNKPPGLAVQGGTGMGARHVNALLAGLAFDLGEPPRLVHRLDKDTSGVLVLGRTANAAARLTTAFRGRDARKCYWAVTVGVPQPAKGRIDAPLAKLPGRRGDKSGVDEEGGRDAETWYRVVDKLGRRAAWLEMEPRTGRTHQLRVHAELMGTPILGDGKYGGKAAFLDGLEVSHRLHLHARAIRLPHPSGGVLEIVAPLPHHMAGTFAALGFNEADAGDPFVAFDES